MGKKAQVTVFIVIAVVIVLAVGAYLLIAKNPQEDVNDEITFEGAGSLKTFVEDCIRETSYAGMTKMSLQGGYINVPDKHFSSVYSDVAYHYYHGEDISPSTVTMENELAYFIDKNLGACIADFTTFKNMGYTIQYGQRASKVTIADNGVVVELSYPVTISDGTDKVNFKTFTFRSDVRLKQINEITKDITLSVLLNPNYIDQTNVLSLMQEYGVQIDTMTAEDGVVLYVIDDPKSIMWPGTNLLFMFATKTDQTPVRPEFKGSENTFTGTVGEQVLISMHATDFNDDRLEYWTNSPIIGIDRYTGIISYVPSSEDVGIHHIEVSVFDGTYTVSREITIIIGGAE